MMYPIRLKTGFFETTPCTLSIQYEGVTLNSPGDKQKDIRVARDDIIAVTITIKRYDLNPKNFVNRNVSHNMIN